MKETSFVKHNKGKWEKFEKLFKQKNNDPDEISELFTEITEDLSYARTFYPRRSVRVYLNHLAQGVFTSLYKQKKQPVKGFFKFWKTTVPMALYHSRKNLLLALVFFLTASIIGAVSQEYDESFAEIILGEGYISATEDRIANGNPMGIYGESEEASMFLRITINNIRVSFFAFVMGIFFGLFTYIILLHNGIMLGAFQWWFKAKGLLLTSFLAIWIHGAFEISAIVIAGGAGITLGNGLLFPKSHSRLQSLIFSGKRGMIILSSLVPIFIIAGTLESFVTRYYQSMPPALNWLIILGSFTIIILYYGIYPFIAAKRNPDLRFEEKPRYIPERKIILRRIKSTGELFIDSTYSFIQKAKLFSAFSFKLVISLSMLLMSIIFYFDYWDFNYEMMWYEVFEQFFGYEGGFDWYKYLSWSFILTLVYTITHFVLSPNEKTKTTKNFFASNIRSLPWLYVFFTAITGVFLAVDWRLLLPFFVFLGFIVLLTPIIISEQKTNVFTAIARTFKLINRSYGQTIGNSSAIGSIILIFFFILHNPFGLGVITFIDELLRDLLIGNTFYYDAIINGFNAFVYVVFLAFAFSLAFTNGYYFYHSLIEKQNANQLKSDIDTIGKRSKTFETQLEFE